MLFYDHYSVSIVYGSLADLLILLFSMRHAPEHEEQSDSAFLHFKTHLFKDWLIGYLGCKIIMIILSMLALVI